MIDGGLKPSTDNEVLPGVTNRQRDHAGLQAGDLAGATSRLGAAGCSATSRARCARDRPVGAGCGPWPRSRRPDARTSARLPVGSDFERRTVMTMASPSLKSTSAQQRARRPRCDGGAPWNSRATIRAIDQAVALGDLRALEATAGAARPEAGGEDGGTRRQSAGSPGHQSGHRGRAAQDVAPFITHRLPFPDIRTVTIGVRRGGGRSWRQMHDALITTTGRVDEVTHARCRRNARFSPN